MFHAANSNTHRHMTKFTGLDLEMAIGHSYLEARTMIGGMLKHTFRSLQTKNSEEMERVKRSSHTTTSSSPKRRPHWCSRMFPDGIKLLKERGRTEEDGEGIDEHEDLLRPAEVRLG